MGRSVSGVRAAPEKQQQDVYPVCEEEKGRIVEDILAVAKAVGVFDAEAHYQTELARLDHDHQRRMDYIKGGVTIAALFGVYVLLAFQTGTP